MFGIIRLLLSILEIGFFVYWALPIFYAPFKNHVIYTYLDKIFSPVLTVFRRLIGKYLPAKYMIFDWSYLAVIVAINILQWIF